MMQTFHLFQHLIPLLYTIHLVDFYHYENLKRKYYGKLCYVSDLVLKETGILVKDFLLFEKLNNRQYYMLVCFYQILIYIFEKTLYGIFRSP